VRIRNQRCVVSALAVLTAMMFAIMTPTLALAWGGQTHRYIAQNYSKHLPAIIDGLRAYDSVVDQKVNDPDIRRPNTPGESYRHFIDIDAYPEYLQGNLSHDRATLESLHGASFVLNTGIVPWAVGDVVATLTGQFAAHDWNGAATTIADLCHYVGDATQPLHCTKNYDGQLSGNSGIHSRYETTMMGQHIGELSTPASVTVFYPSAIEAMFDIVDDSWAGVAPVLAADNTARAASGGSYNTTYYNSLWNSTQAMTRARINAATLSTASFVYTAWRNAGEPPVPGSNSGVDPATSSISGIDAWPMPFRGVLEIRYQGRGPLAVDVLDSAGRRLTRLVDEGSGPGTTRWTPPGKLGAGMYFLRLTSADGTKVKRVVRLD